MKKTILIVFFTIVLATGLKWYHNATIDKGTLDNGPSCSISESKARGIFMCQGNIKPWSIPIGFNKVEFNESWFETRKKTTFEYIWFEKSRQVNGIKFCFTLKHGDKFLKADGEEHFFVIEDMGSGVGINHKPECVVFSENLDDLNKSGFRMSLIHNWQEKRPKNIFVEPFR